MSPDSDGPTGTSAEVHVLVTGYLGPHTASTVSYVRDGAARVIIDPGMVHTPGAILDALAALGESAAAITEVNVLQIH